MSKVTLDKIKINKDDILIIKDPDCVGFDFAVFDRLTKLHSDNTIVYLTGNMTLQMIDEEEMNHAGWFKKGGNYEK